MFKQLLKNSLKTLYIASTPGVTQQDGSKVVLVSDDAADGLVDSTSGLLSVPLLPRQTLKTQGLNICSKG